MRDVPLELLGNCPVEPCPHGEVLTADEDVAAAAKELDEGDLRHAAHHVAAALAVDPLKPEHRALCDRLLAASPDGPALFPLVPPVFAGNLVGHACALHRQAHTGRALPLLVQAAHARPGPAYLGLAADWMSTPAHLKRPKAQELVQLLQPWVGDWILSRVTLSPALRRDLEAFRPALEQLLKLHASSAQLQLLGATYLRLLGRTAMAVTVASRAHTAAATFHTCAALGLAHQAKGDAAAAIRLFRKALELDPSSTGLELELGDLHIDLGQPAGALAYYAKAEEKTGATPLLEAGRLAARAKKAGDPAALEGLRRLACGDPPLERAREWLEKLGHPLPRPTPYVDHLPEASEASLNLLRKVVLRSGGKTQGVLLNAAVDGIEPPSAQLAFALLAEGLGMQTTIRVARVQEPDPREPAAEVAHRLWRWEGTHAHPALDAPPPELAAAVAEVARHPFSLAA
jgi:tetratricopeptide (TPR) repeat protein